MSLRLSPASPWRPSGRSSRVELAIQDCLIQDLRAEDQENVILNIQKISAYQPISTGHPCKGFPLLPFIPWLIFLIS